MTISILSEKVGNPSARKFGAVTDFLDRHPHTFQAFDVFNPCEVFIAIAAAVAVITGESSGIGYETAKVFARRGKIRS